MMIAWVTASAWLLTIVAAAPTPPPAACETPASQRTSEIGCYLTAVEPLGSLPATPLFWHLYVYPNRAAAEAARGPRWTRAHPCRRRREGTTAPPQSVLLCRGGSS